MRKLRNFVVGIIFFWCLPLQAQDTVRVKHTNYETVFSQSKKYPVLVQWWVTKEKLTCKIPAKRGDKFVADPLISNTDLSTDYIGSGFDRGHLSPAGDNACLGKSVMDESFFYTNMVPQYPGLNRGQWKALEDHTRELARSVDSVFVEAGCVGDLKKIKTVSVPTYCWKIIRIQQTGEIRAYSFKNVPEKSKSITEHLVTVDSVNNLRKQ